MEKRDLINFIILILLIIISVAVFFYDLSIIKFIESNRNIYFSYVFFGINFLSNLFIIFFLTTTLFLWKKRNKWIPAIIGSTFFSIVIAFSLKNIIRRPRPFIHGITMLVPMDEVINYISWDFSFPSFQTMLVFAMLPIIDKEFKTFRYYWFVFAVLIGFSRVYLGVHYLSDVLGGAIIGYLIGFIMVKIEERYRIGHKIDEKVFGIK